MLVSDALEIKGTDVATIEPNTPVVDIARILKGKGIGAVMIIGENGAIAGIISERDIVHGIAMHGKGALDMPVSALMTDQVITCKRSDRIDFALQQMIAHACRHLPVVENGELAGLVSMSDVVKLRIKQLQDQIAQSKTTAPGNDPDDLDDWPVKA